jgi:hypothetical protein
MDNTEINILKNYIHKLLQFFEGERFDYFNSNKNLIQNVIGQYLRNKYGNINYSDINTFKSKDTEKIVHHLNTIYNNNIENIHKQTKKAYPSLYPNTPDDDIAGDIPLTVFKRNGGKSIRKSRHKLSRRKLSRRKLSRRKTKNT